MMRALNFLIASADGVMLAFFVLYLRGLYGATAGQEPMRYTAARVGMFVLVLLVVVMLAENFANLRHVGNLDDLYDTAAISVVVRFVVFACLTGIFILMAGWFMARGEKKYRGRWARLDHLMDRALGRHDTKE